MEVLFERCCGLDIHKRTVVACLVVPGSTGAPTKDVRSFGTMTDELLQLADWLSAAGCTHVAMESTGVYWKPIWNLLEGQFVLLLLSARHVKAVPGRKTDAKDCEWVADLLRHGLLRGSPRAMTTPSGGGVPCAGGRTAAEPAPCLQQNHVCVRRHARQSSLGLSRPG